MTNPLFPCPSCSRHVRLGTAACPFCAHALPASPEHLVPGASASGMTRAALFAFATTVAACSSPQPAQPTTPAAVETPAPAPAPSEDASTPPGGNVVTSPPAVNTNEPPMMVAMYGAPPMPVQPVTPLAAASPADAAADAPADAPARDAARDAGRPRRDAAAAMPDPGTIMVRYGAPPADFA